MRRENGSGLVGVQLVIVFEMLPRLLPRKPRGTMNPAGLPCAKMDHLTPRWTTSGLLYCSADRLF